MARTIPLIEPTVVTAGSTWTWKMSSPDFPIAEGWTLSYAIRGVSAPAWDASWVTNDGAQFTVEIPPASTLAIEPGRYEFIRIWTGSGSYAGERYDERLAPLTVRADPVTADEGALETFAEKNLRYVETAIAGRFSNDMPVEYTIGGREVVKMGIRDLLHVRAKLREEVWRERNPGRAYPTTRVRFVSP